MSALAALLCVLGFGALGLFSDRHHQPRLGRRRGARTRRYSRLAAAALLAAAFAAAVAAWGWAFGPVAWAGLAMAGAAASVLLLNLLPASWRAAARSSP